LSAPEFVIEKLEVGMSKVLSSWKEIAGHLGKGIRTVQRWERELGFPVRRPGGKGKHIVLADSDELDAWMLGRKHDGTPADSNHEMLRMQQLLSRVREQASKVQSNAANVVKAARDLGELQERRRKASNG
jgi:hypothetical protein